MPFTKGHKINLGKKNHLGHKHTEATKNKIKLKQKKNIGKYHRFSKGYIPWNKGKHYIPKNIERFKNANINRKFTKKHKRNLSLSHKGQVGKWSGGWKGGKTLASQLVRSSLKYEEWRRNVFIRDNFTCQDCGEKGVYLEAHHKEKSFSILMGEAMKYFPLLNIYDACMLYSPLWDIDNGITLCEDCHNETKSGL